MLQPTVRRTWAPKGRTPILKSYDRRDRLSALSAITVSPQRRRLGLAEVEAMRLILKAKPNIAQAEGDQESPRKAEAEFRQALQQFIDQQEARVSAHKGSTLHLCLLECMLDLHRLSKK